MNNRYLPSITLASDILDDIIAATELEIFHLIKQLEKYDSKGERMASKVTMDGIYEANRKLRTYKDM